MGSDATTKDDELVTVVIPCYRQEQYLPEAVASVRAQTFQNWEVVIATGDYPSTAAAYDLARVEPRIRLVIDGCDRGVSDARNLAIAQRRGAHVLPLDADDILEPTFLERMWELRPPSGDYICSCALQEFGSRSHIWYLPTWTNIRENNCLLTASLFSGALWDRVRESNGTGYDVSLIGYEDWSFWLSCAEYEPHIVTIRDTLFRYRAHADSQTSWDTTHQAGNYWRAMLRLRHPRLYDLARLQRDRDLIGRMSPYVYAPIAKRLRQFPDHPGLLLWQQLVKGSAAA